MLSSLAKSKVEYFRFKMEGDYLYHIGLTLENDVKERFRDVKVSSRVNQYSSYYFIKVKINII